MTDETKPWPLLLLLSAVLVGVLHLLQLPASVLLGCMLAGIWMGYRGHALSPHRALFAFAQGVLGCLIASSLQLPILHRLAADWPFFLGVTLSVIVASALLGWYLMRMQILPGTTAVWGLAPGAASAMVLMSEDFGADVRLVAFMQYSRVVVVTALASLVAHWGSHHAATPIAATDWWVLTSPANVGATLLVAGGAAAVARRFGLPGGAMWLPMVLAMALPPMGFFQVELPQLVLAMAYALIGWSIGLRFNRASLLYAWRVLPVVFGAIMALVVVGCLHALVLSQWVGFDVLTAYLATSPGGADSVAVIAATSAVDAGFVMAMQMARFVMVLVAGPAVSRWVASRQPRGS
jgi:hypothetical protein